MAWLRISVLVLGMTAVTRAATADPPREADAPYAAWDGRAPLPAPPPEEPRALPSPLDRPSDFSRRTVEIDPEFGFALPSCAGRVDEHVPCAALANGVALSLAALWRQSPYFAFGGGAMLADFGGSKNTLPAGAHGSMFELAAIGRVYMLEAGRIEPYLELWIGGGSQRTNALEISGASFEQQSSGVGGRVGGGVDFYLGSHVRLGPTFGAARFFTGTLRSCPSDLRCAPYSIDERGQLLGTYVFALRMAIGFGSRL